MPLLPDINMAAIQGEDPQKQIDSIIKQLNEWGRLISNEDRTKIIKDDAGVARILQGFQQDGFSSGNVGMKVSQPEIDVQSATDDELIFNSDNNVFKIVQSGVIEIEAPLVSGDNPHQESVAHGLGYAPLVIAYYETSGHSEQLPFISVGLNGTANAGKVSYMLYHYSDDTNVNFVWVDSSQNTGGVYPIRYYILRETAKST